MPDERRLDAKYDPPTHEQLQGDVAGVALAEDGNPDHGPYVVFRAACGAHGYYCVATFRDPVGHGVGDTPREAMISLARSLRDAADKLIASASRRRVLMLDTKLKFGDLARDEHFICWPLPGDNSGHGGYLGAHRLFVKTGELTANSSNGIESSMNERMDVIKISLQ